MAAEEEAALRMIQAVETALNPSTEQQQRIEAYEVDTNTNSARGKWNLFADFFVLRSSLFILCKPALQGSPTLVYSCSVIFSLCEKRVCIFSVYSTVLRSSYVSENTSTLERDFWWSKYSDLH